MSGKNSTEETVPETGEWMFAEMKPEAFAINCPARTLSPFATTGSAGAPKCWLSATKAVSTSGNSSIAAFAEILLSFGWIPPSEKVLLIYDFITIR
ncbi:hypothetical protein SDC9_161846 [bioreactor metagenome]|uniref:Uncharacterized protein n=1 Tax=bioreactor metagenome TaxID=1076179 RepID=A0A645FMF3_9ZZZZ